ncbi:hypothetical protein GIB67_016656, partial [Kingdonia uniflora]
MSSLRTGFAKHLRLSNPFKDTNIHKGSLMRHSTMSFDGDNTGVVDDDDFIAYRKDLDPQGVDPKRGWGFRGVHKAIICGKIGQAPVQKILRNGRTVTIFTVGTGGMFDQRIVGAEHLPKPAQWHRIAVHNEQLGAYAVQQIVKGSPVFVEGDIETRVYNDSISGQVKNIPEICVRRDGKVRLIKTGEKVDNISFDELSSVVPVIEVFNHICYPVVLFRSAFVLVLDALIALSASEVLVCRHHTYHFSSAPFCSQKSPDDDVQQAYKSFSSRKSRASDEKHRSDHSVRFDRQGEIVEDWVEETISYKTLPVMLLSVGREREYEYRFYEERFREVMVEPVARKDAMRLIAEEEIKLEDARIVGGEMIGCGSPGHHEYFRIKPSSVDFIDMGTSPVNEASTSSRSAESEVVISYRDEEVGVDQFLDFSRRLVTYPLNSDVFKEFCKAKASVGGRWGSLVEHAGRHFRSCIITTGEEYFFLLAALEKEKRDRGLDESISLEYFDGNRDVEEPMELLRRTVKQNPQSQVTRKEPLLDTVAQEGTELEAVLKELSISRKKRANSQSEKVQKSQATRLMAGAKGNNKRGADWEKRVNLPKASGVDFAGVPESTMSSKIARAFPKKKMLKRGSTYGTTRSGEVEGGTKKKKGRAFRTNRGEGCSFDEGDMPRGRGGES